MNEKHLQIRPEHRVLIAKVTGGSVGDSASNYSESTLCALLIVDEIRRSSAQICKAIAKIQKETPKNN